MYDVRPAVVQFTARSIDEPSHRTSPRIEQAIRTVRNTPTSDRRRSRCDVFTGQRHTREECDRFQALNPIVLDFGLRRAQSAAFRIGTAATDDGSSPVALAAPLG